MVPLIGEASTRCPRCGSGMGDLPHNCVSMVRWDEHQKLRKRVKEIQALADAVVDAFEDGDHVALADAVRDYREATV